MGSGISEWVEEVLFQFNGILDVFDDDNVFNNVLEVNVVMFVGYFKIIVNDMLNEMLVKELDDIVEFS